MSSTAGSPPEFALSATPVETKPLIARRPSLLMKPAQTPPAASPPPNNSSTTLSLTSKEWVIPPRPKPGRKPATDTPPTKRKAQNRAAQRAFRERRAARVGELEEQIKQVEDEHEREQDLLRADVATLEKEVEKYRADLVVWVDRCRTLEHELLALKATHNTASDLGRATSISSRPMLEASSTEHEPADTVVGCGNCTLDTRCQCIDDAFDAMNGEHGQDIGLHEKRAHSPAHQPRDKRVKIEPTESLETDFTTFYTSKPQTITTRTATGSPTTAPADPCGFCSDGTPCICAEMAADQAQAQAATNVQRPVPEADRAPALAQFTPPPSDGDVSIPIPAATKPTTCAGGPGTCAQCRADPNSTLFCKALAASRSQSANTRTDCCGGKSLDGNCCQAVPLPRRTTRSRAVAAQAQKPSVTLTCADAFTTLSRHPGYERASSQMTTWMPKLYANDLARTMEDRPAMEIDAANVMAVLKDFDRRFGQNR